MILYLCFAVCAVLALRVPCGELRCAPPHATGRLCVLLQGGCDDVVRVSAHAPPGVPAAGEGRLPWHGFQGYARVECDRK